MISASNLSISFEGRTVLDAASLTIAPGNKVGLVGINGSGKTTLLRILTGELTPDSGSVLISKKIYKISYVPQHLTLLPDHHDQTIMAFMLEGKKLLTIKQRMKALEELIEEEKDEQRGVALLDEYVQLQGQFNVQKGYRAQDDILKILKGLGLRNVNPDQKISSISGGQKTRLALARMLFEDSDVLILDEPTNHIDEGSVKWFADYLAKVSKTILVVSHIPEFLDKVVSRIILVKNGHLKSYPGNFSKFIMLRRKESDASARATEKLLAEIERHRRFIRGASQSKSGMKHSREKLVAKMEKQHLPFVRQNKKMKFQIPLGAIVHSIMLSVNSLSKSFNGKRVLEGISFEISPTERLGIMGVNGVGKTTLLKIIAGEIRADKGSVNLNPKSEIGWYRQEQEGLNDDFSVLDEIRSSGNLSAQHIRNALAHFLFPHDRINQKVGTLSRGERARLALCKIVLGGSNFLLLDEPTNHLDQFSRSSLIEALATYKGAMLVVSHDQEFLESIGVTWGLRLPRGEMVRIH